MSTQTLRFGVFTLRLDTNQLDRRGTPVKLQEQPLQLLRYLAERPEQVVTREELREHLWPDTFVDFDTALNTTVGKLRRALGDSAENPRFIETLPKRGYRFIAPVETTIAETPVAAAPSLATPPEPTPHRSRLPLMVAAAGILFGVAVWLAIHYYAGPTLKIDSVAVLPFNNAVGDTQLEYLTDGLAESLIDSLAGLPGLRVMAPGTTMVFKGRTVDPRQAGRELKVAAVVQGRVSKQGDLLEVDANLVDATSGAELWRGKYRRPSVDELSLEQEIASDLRRSLTNRSSNTDTPGAHRSTQNKEAYRHYLQGLYEMRQLTSGGAEGALQHFQQAIALDSSYVSAYYGLAGTYELLDDWVVAPKDSVPKALAAVQKGLELDPSFAEAHTLLGTIHFWYDFDQAAAEKEFLRGIELNTNFDDGHDFYGWFLGAHKRIDQSIAEHRRAMELSPLDLQHHLALSQSLYYNHRYDEAYEELRTTLLQNPNAWWGHEILGWVYEQKGDLPRAVAEEKKAVELEPKIAEPLASLGRMYALSGDRAAALKIAGQLEEWKRRDYVSPYAPAILYEGLGDQRRALAEYQSAYEARSWLVDFAATDPKLDRIRGDKKFQDIQRAVGVP